MPKTRNKKITFSPAERAAYKDKASRIDREEKAAILEQARRAKARRALLHHALADLKAERERRGLSLADLSARTGISKANLSRLETAANANPTIDTLIRYARALDVELKLAVA